MGYIINNLIFGFGSFGCIILPRLHFWWPYRRTHVSWVSSPILTMDFSVKAGSIGPGFASLRSCLSQGACYLLASGQVSRTLPKLGNRFTLDPWCHWIPYIIVVHPWLSDTSDSPERLVLDNFTVLGRTSLLDLNSTKNHGDTPLIWTWGLYNLDVFEYEVP